MSSEQKDSLPNTVLKRHNLSKMNKSNKLQVNFCKHEKQCKLY